MKKFLFLLAMLPMMCLGQSAKPKMRKVIGTVTYKSSIGSDNKVDVGSIVYFIPADKFKHENSVLLDSIKAGVKSQTLYNKLYKTLYNKEQVISLIGKEYIPYDQTLDREVRFLNIYNEIKNGEFDRCLIDASGKYEITIPEGEYYVLFKSSNKTIDVSMLFGTGLIDIQKEKVKSSKYNIISNVFNIIIAE